MGSPELAVPSFHAVRETDRIVGVVTQPPRASGRGRRITPSAIAREAALWGYPVLTPDRLKTPDFEETLRELEPDIAVVVAYGRILPPNILRVPRLGCVNVHASILPELRGAAPIQWAIARGYAETGVTLMQMDEGMDTGPILLQRTLSIGDDETAGELAPRLSLLGADLLREGLPLLERRALPSRAQDESRATYAPLLTKEDGLVDWSLAASEIANRVRGFSPWPGSYTMRKGSRLLITGARPEERPSESLPGTVVQADGEGIHVSCGSGTLRILTVKPEGKKEMDVSGFLAGHRVREGEVWGRGIET